MTREIPTSPTESQIQYQSTLNRLIRFIRGDDFIAFATKVHKDIEYSKFADRLENQVRRLKGEEGKINIVEFYFICQQINTEILTKIVASIATQSIETTTQIPVVKQISYCIDQLVLITIKISEFIAKNIAKIISKGSERNNQVEQEGWLKKQITDWYNDNIQLSINEMKETIKSLKMKHQNTDSLADDSQIKLSTLACTAKLIVILLNLKTRIITGIVSKSAGVSGHVINDVTRRLQIVPLVKELSVTIKELMEGCFTHPMQQLAIFLRGIDKIGENLQTYVNQSREDNPYPSEEASRGCAL